MMKRSLLSALLLLVPALAFGQSTVIQGGSFTAGHVPQYNTSSGQPTVRDGGTAAGTTASGGNPSTLGLTSRCSNPPCDGASNSQGGPNGENFAIFDAPTGDSDGYHYLGFSANVGGKAVITTGAGGGAAAQGLDFIIDGTTYNFPGDFPQIPVTVPQGGTGRTSLTDYNLLVGAGTSNVGLIAPSATTGVPLVSQGSSANPAYGTASIAGGGTGATTASDALNNLLPAQTGQNGKVLSTDGSDASWINIPGTGTVTSVTFSNGLTADINPCVASCTASLANIADDRMLANVSGGAGVPTATTNTQWMDATVGSAQGSLVTRGAATWSALTPGTNGYALLSQGPGSDLVFGPYLINNLAIASQAQGDVVYYNGSNWTRLAAGTNGQFLQTQGAGANPKWATPQGLPGYIYNLTLSNNVSDATNDIDIAIGSAADNSSGRIMTLGSALTKRTDASWAVGTNQGCLDTGVVGNNTYHFFLINRSDTNVTDVLCSLSPTAPTMPANYDSSRRIGSIVRAGGAIRPFLQFSGGYFYLVTPVLDFNSAIGNTPTTITLSSIPTGVNMTALINGYSDAGGGYYIRPVGITDQSIASGASPLASFQTGTASGGSFMMVATNTSAQVRGVTVAGATLRVVTIGWIDDRGQSTAP